MVNFNHIFYLLFHPLIKTVMEEWKLNKLHKVVKRFNKH